MKSYQLKLVTVAAAGIMAAGTTFGQSSDAILDLLMKKGVINQREANEVREQLDQQTAQAVDLHSKVKAASWLDAIKLTGDLRLRGEYFDYEDALNKPERLRFRYRLRAGAEAQYQDWAAVNFRLASSMDEPAQGNGTGDGVSNNQTLTGSWRKKPVYIDAAYVTLRAPGSDFAKVQAGKMDLPIWQPKFNSPMVYDFDNTPEGVAEQLQLKFGDKEQVRVFGNFGQFVLKEFSSDWNDSYLFDIQGGVEAKLGDPKNPTLRATLAGGFFWTSNLDNFSQTYDSNNKGNASRNIISGGKTNNVAYCDFSVANVRGEVAWLIADKPVLGTPAVFTVSGEYLANGIGDWEKLVGAAGSARTNLNQTSGWTLQAQFGEAKKWGQWQVAYQYKRLEADATWDAITDSDFGNGGTDRQGHILKAAYNIRDWWQVGCSAFITEKISHRINGKERNQEGVAGQDQVRLQVDTVLKF